MNPGLLEYLCDPDTGDPLTLRDAVHEPDGRIVTGTLQSASGRRYPITNGIPRFVGSRALNESVRSFGDEWNHFNFTDFRVNWVTHTVKNTFGSVEAFRGQLIVDAGGGSGAQTLWMLQAGARHVIMLELSDSVDDVVQRNLAPSGFTNFDVIQCSIDAPPLRVGSIDGIVYCHNVIQHTPSVEATARALFDLVAPGGEFVFNCYPLNDRGPLRWIRHHVVFRSLRAVLSRMPFGVILAYARLMGMARLIPGLGPVLEKLKMCTQGDVPRIDDEGPLAYLARRYRATVLNTFDAFGSHTYQHHKPDAEIRSLVRQLQPDPGKIANMEAYFTRPQPIGCALRIAR